MTRICWVPQGLEDVQAIRTYLSRDFTAYADLMVEQIVHAVSRLETHPRSSRVVPEVGEPSLREIIIGSYRIVYQLQRDDAFVLTVFHGARPFPVR